METRPFEVTVWLTGPCAFQCRGHLATGDPEVNVGPSVDLVGVRCYTYDVMPWLSASTLMILEDRLLEMLG